MALDCPQIKTASEKILDLRSEFAMAYSGVDKSKGSHDLANQQAIQSLETKMKKIKDALIELKSLLHVSLEQAQEIMDQGDYRGFMGPEQVKLAFGIEAQDIPEIPFSRREIKRAKELGQMLILRVDRAPGGQPLTMKKISELLLNNPIKRFKGQVVKHVFTEEWYENEDFFLKETPQPGWVLVSREVITDTTECNYLIQTEKLIKYLTDDVFQNTDIPEIYRQAIKEFNQVRKQEKLDELIDQDWRKAAQILENLQITRLLRQSPAEVLYDLMIYFQNNEERLLPKTYCQTRRRCFNGLFVRAGLFELSGVLIGREEPYQSSKNFGVCLSRRS